ncbi:capsid maturation protease [Equid gammaherpesvirus 2]|nr:capsid maturation protease [Equid gammaherpesvirus 2]
MSSPSPSSSSDPPSSLAPVPAPPGPVPEAAAASRASRAPVYLGGFVDVFSYPKDSRALYLNPADVGAHLPLPGPIPLNVEHLQEAHVGWTLGLHLTRYGLFCVAVITAEEFFALLDRLCAASSVARTRADHHLPPNPTLEMLHTWLPELSLSSIHPDALPGTKGGDTPIFQHVALCAMGQRRGTVAVYGESLDWILSKFTSLSPEERGAIAEGYASPGPESLPEPHFTCSNEILMAKAIDAGFIKNRLEILKTDKGVAEVKAPTYLKASVQGLPANLDEVDSARGGEDPPTAAIATTPHPAAETTTMNQQQPFAAQAPAGGCEDLISVPRSTFMTMLQTNLDTMRQTSLGQRFGQPIDAPAAPPAQLRVPPPAAPFPVHPGYYPAPYHPQVDAQAQYLPYVPLPPPGAMPFAPPPLPDFYKYGGIPAPGYSPVAHPARPGKRKRDCDEEFEGPLFPGEIHKDVQSLSKSIAALQSELKDIKNSQQFPQPPPQPQLQPQAQPQPQPAPQLYPAPPQAFYHPAAGDHGYYVRYLNPFQASGGVPCAPGPQGVGEPQAPQVTVTHNGQQAAPQAGGGATGATAANVEQRQPEGGEACGAQQQQPPQPQPQQQQQPQQPQQQAFVEASTKPSQISQLQKIFCEELLNKT